MFIDQFSALRDVAAWTCRCPPGYVTQVDSGLCERQICTDGVHQCLNFGTCSGPSSCNCMPGFSGDHCQNGKSCSSYTSPCELENTEIN